MRKLRLLTLALAASMLFAACPSDEEDEDAVLLLGGFVEQMYQVQAAKLAECTPAISSVYLSMAEGPVAQAKLDLEKAVMTGRLVYHADKAAECLQQLRATPCESISEESSSSDDLAACEAAFEPKVAAGGDCYMDDECVGGYCTEGASCPGKCVAYAKENESCVDVSCDSDLDLYCDGTVCLKQKAAGADCVSRSECLGELECAFDGKCAAVVEPVPAKLGETCGDVECAEGLFCDSPSLGEDGTCVATLAAGAECGEDYFAAYSECGSKLACAGFSQSISSGVAVKGKCAVWADINGACTQAPAGTVGISGCKIGLACQDSKCAIPPTTGACLEADLLTPECDPRSAYCDAADQCVAKKADGEVCEENEECKSGDCLDGLCFSGCHP